MIEPRLDENSLFVEGFSLASIHTRDRQPSVFSINMNNSRPVRGVNALGASITGRSFRHIEPIRTSKGDLGRILPKGCWTGLTGGWLAIGSFEIDTRLTEDRITETFLTLIAECSLTRCVRP
jgi:hypothetical protein